MSFQFKEFIVHQDSTAMKVGTDGVLLGAWVNPIESNILDIGTGTGLIALMLAQRTNKAIIEAVEINAAAYKQAENNFLLSKWKSRLNPINESIQNFTSQKKYDLIVSNPPYFVNSTKAPDDSRSTARHSDSLSFNELLHSVTNLLSLKGTFSLILPVNEATLFLKLATSKKLYLNRRCKIKPNINKDHNRVLMDFSFTPVKHFIDEQLTIETEKRHEYTKEYITLTKDFYLNF